MPSAVPDPTCKVDMTPLQPPPPPPHHNASLMATSPDATNLITASAPANITVVTSAKQLQQAALAQAEDIEIRAHLDLRTLHRVVNPDIRGMEALSNSKRLALLYGTRQLRSVRVRTSKSFTWTVSESNT